MLLYVESLVQVETAEQFVGLQPLLARQLQGADADEAVGRSYTQVGLAVGLQAARLQVVCLGNLFCLEHFQYHRRSVGLHQFGPGRGIGREAAYEVVDALHGLVPVDAARFLEDFGSRFQFARHAHLLLRDAVDGAVQNGVHGFGHQLAAQHHQLVVNDAHVVRIGNGDAYLLDDLARINFMLQEEGRDARLRLAVDDGPVDGRSSAVLGQQGGVQVEGAQAG